MQRGFLLASGQEEWPPAIPYGHMPVGHRPGLCPGSSPLMSSKRGFASFQQRRCAGLWPAHGSRRNLLLEPWPRALPWVVTQEALPPGPLAQEEQPCCSLAEGQGAWPPGPLGPGAIHLGFAQMMGLWAHIRASP